MPRGSLDCKATQWDVQARWASRAQKTVSSPQKSYEATRGHRLSAHDKWLIQFQDVQLKIDSDDAIDIDLLLNLLYEVQRFKLKDRVWVHCICWLIVF